MASKSTELKNLNSRDEATRRKAVRWLFENDVKESLPSFISFLSDDDIWFRERAKMAFKKWTTDEYFELIDTLLEDKTSSNEYFISTILSNFSSKSEDLVVKLLKSDNFDIKYETAVDLFNDKKYSRSLTLFEDILSEFKGSSKSEDIYTYQL